MLPKFFFGQQHRGRNQVGIQPDIAGVLHQFDQILARGGFAAGEMDLQHADLGKLREHLLPFFGGQFAAAAIEFDRIGAVRALQRAAVRQLGEHRERNAKGLGGPRASEHREPVAGIFSRRLDVGDKRAHDVFSRASVRNPLSARSCSMAITSVGDRAAVGNVFRGKHVDHLADAARAVAELQHFDRDFVRRQHAFRRQDHPDLPGLVEFQLGMPRQHRPAFFADLDVAAAGGCHRSIALRAVRERTRPAEYGHRHRHDTARRAAPIAHWS